MNTQSPDNEIEEIKEPTVEVDVKEEDTSEKATGSRRRRGKRI